MAFQNLPRTEFVGPGRRRVLLEPLIWDDGKERIEIPGGFYTDFYSWHSLGQFLVPNDLEHMAPSILHDFEFVLQRRSLWQVDTLLYRGMRAGTVGVPNSVVPLWRTLPVITSVRIGSWVPWNRNAELIAKDRPAFLRSHGLSPYNYPA